MKELDPLFGELERRNGLPAGLLRGMATAESAGNPRAVSPAGAMGMFQFMPSTAKEYGIDPYDPRQAADAAARKLAGLMKRYGGDTSKALQAYNWGEGNMASGKPMPAETQAYPGKVLGAVGAKGGGVDQREELQALRRLAELEDKVAAGAKAPASVPASKPQSNMAADLAGGLLRGAGSIGATLLAPIDAAARALNNGKPIQIGGYDIAGHDRRAGMDGGLQAAGVDTGSGAFTAGKIGAEVAGTLGVGGVLANGARAVGAAPAVVNALASSGFATGRAPQVGAMAKAGDLAFRSAAGAATGGASAALVDPSQAGIGAAVGGALPGAALGLGKVARGVGKALGPNIENPALAAKAINEYGIPLGMADISGSTLTKAARSVLNDAPLTGGIGSRQKEAVQGGFNRAIGQTFGADAPKLTPDVLDAAKKRMGAEFDRIWGQNALQVDGDLFKAMQALRDNAAKLPQGEGARVSAWMDDLERQMVPGPNGELHIPGEVANRFQSKLRQDAEKATGFLKSDLQDLRKSLIGAFNRSVSPADAAALSKNMGQYKAYKTVEPLLQGAEAGIAGRSAGDVPAALLPQAVRKSYGSNIAGSPFSDLSQIGSQYVADRVARTGGSARAALQNSIIGSALGMGGFANPLAAAAVIPAGMATNALMGSPALASRLAASKGFNALALPPELQVQLFRAAPALASDR